MLLFSLITPVILIVLYATFLANVYKDSFLSALPDAVQVSDKLINGTVAAIGDSLDCNPVFHGHVVSVNQMVFIMVTSIVILGILYLIITSEGEFR